MPYSDGLENTDDRHQSDGLNFNGQETFLDGTDGIATTVEDGITKPYNIY
tara:strand:+ start:1323 stop:1472 length:150 start_codon:yes stop_codon:yes gene_type:complete